MRMIRLATPDDARQVQEIYGPVVENTCISFETEPPGEAAMRERIRSTLALYPWLVCEEEGRLSGYAYASRHRERAAYQWSADASVYVREGQRRSGVGRALYTSLLAGLQRLGLCAVHAGITMPNPPSVGLHESFGFRAVALFPAVGWKHGAWHAVGYWQKRFREEDGEPAALASMDALLRSAEWEEALKAGTRQLAR